MLSTEVLKKVRRIQIISDRLVNDILAGEYHSVFKGQGMEFDEVREYQPGDDVRAIDWNVTARTGRPFLKKFVEERELTVMLVVDASASENFGTQKEFKKELAAEVGALLAFSAIKNNDKVGLLMFTDTVEKFIPPKKGKRHVLRVIREILYFKPKNKKTDLEGALKYLFSVSKRKSVTFLISDFYAENYEKALRLANKRHDIIAVTLHDAREAALPSMGLTEFMDPETGEMILVDTDNKKVQKAYQEHYQVQLKKRSNLFKSCKVDEIAVVTGSPYVESFMKFFKMREKRM